MLPISAVSAQAPAPPASPELSSGFADPMVLLGTVSNAFATPLTYPVVYIKQAPYLPPKNHSLKIRRNSTDIKYCFPSYHQKQKLLKLVPRWSSGLGSLDKTRLPPALGDKGTPLLSTAAVTGTVGQTEGSE